MDDDYQMVRHAFLPRRMPGPQLQVRTREQLRKNYCRAIDFFKLFFTSFLVQTLCTFTNQYAELHSSDKISYSWQPISESEMYRFIGCVIYMGFVILPNVDCYWSVASLYQGNWARRFIPSRDRFKSILSFLHVVNPNSEDREDKLCKVRFLLDYIKLKCAELYQPGIRICIDERMVKSKGRFSMRQYARDKPVKFGFKLWVLADSLNGYTYDFKVYCGKSSTVVSEKGLSYDVVFALMKNLLDQGYELYFDNYYTSLPLMLDLFHRKTYACGTASQNRRGFPWEFKVDKKQWESSSQRGDCRWVRLGNVLALQWRDSRVVSVLSPVHKGNQVTNCQRRGKVNGEFRRLQLQQPRAISDYNKFMKGVDQSDQLLSYYNVLRKSDKFWKTLFFHVIDISVVNAYILFEEVRRQYPDVPELQ